jgi:DNA-binding LacI/PurR family transcriptional regulator
VPEDVSVTGFDNIKLSEFCHPPLTTIHIPRDLIGQMAFESLVADAANHVPEGRDLSIVPEFIVRESTAPLRQSGL